jgi:hypothetical protein
VLGGANVLPYLVCDSRFDKYNVCGHPQHSKLGGVNMWGIGGGVGKEAVDGAVKRIGELIGGINPDNINAGLSALASKIPVLNMLVAGYNAMSDEEKAEFAKNVMLAAAAMAAKNGGKVSF